jgi:hypothetical protein
MPRTTAAATCSELRSETTRGSFTPVSAYMPASAMKLGNTTVTPTPVPCRSSRTPEANPRRPNLVAE